MLDHEADPLRLVVQHGTDDRAVELLRSLATDAYREDGHIVLMLRIATSDVRIQRFEPVDPPLVDELLEQKDQEILQV